MLPVFISGKARAVTLVRGNVLLDVMQMTLDQVINKLSRSELERLKKCAEHGLYDELLLLLKAYGFDESDTPASIGQRVKRSVR